MPQHPSRAFRRSGPGPERNPESVLGALRVACASHPTQRVAQVLVNALGPDPFYIEDVDARTLLYDYAKEGQG